MTFAKNFLLPLVFCVGMLNFTIAQNQKTPNFSEGIIKYKIEVEGMPQAAQFTDNLLINVFFKEKDAKIDFAMMGMSVQFINNRSKDLTTMLMNIPAFYEKTAVNFDKNSSIMQELLKAKKTNVAPTKTPKIEYNKRKKKRIAKYMCHLAKMEVEGQIVKFYVTDKLRPIATANITEDKNLKNLEGFPLAMEMEIEGMTLKFTAIDVAKQSVEAATFEIPESYTMKSLDEFIKEVKAKTGGAGQSGIGL